MSLASILSGYWYSQLLYVAAALGVADALHPEPLSLPELADACDADPDALARIMRALCSLGLFNHDASAGTYALNPISQQLRGDHPNTLRPLALMTGAPWHWRAWGHTLDAARSGRSAFEHAHGEGLFAHLDAEPEARALFARVMSGPDAWNRAVVDAWDGPPVERLVDIGGGDGALARAFLEAWPECRARVLERPPVAAELPDHPRLEALPGDVFSSVPGGASLYLLRFILHDWADDDALRILTRCRQAMTHPEARLLIIEKLLDRSPHDAALFDVTMLVLTGGRERTEAQYRALLDAAGLQLTRVLPTTAGLFILDVTPRG